MDPDPAAHWRPRALRAKRLRYRLLHTAAPGDQRTSARLRLQANWPWAQELAAAFARLRAHPADPATAGPATTNPRSHATASRDACPNTAPIAQHTSPQWPPNRPTRPGPASRNDAYNLTKGSALSPDDD